MLCVLWCFVCVKYDVVMNFMGFLFENLLKLYCDCMWLVDFLVYK